MLNKEKIVRDLVNTFNDRDEFHEAYKDRMKEILKYFTYCLREYLKEEVVDIHEFIDKFVEERFRPQN